MICDKVGARLRDPVDCGMPRKKKPHREDPKKLREDTAETAFRVLQEAIGERPKTVPPHARSKEDRHPEAVKLGQKGGEKGGKARIESLTERQRRNLAKKAAKKRWEDSETA